MRDSELARSVDRVLQKRSRPVMLAGSIGIGEHQTTAACHEAASGRRFKFFPDVIGAQNQWNTFAALADGLPRDASVAVRRALIVRRREAVDADHPCLQLGSLIDRSAAYRAKADDKKISSQHLALSILAFGSWPLAWLFRTQRSSFHNEPRSGGCGRSPGRETGPLVVSKIVRSRSGLVTYGPLRGWGRGKRSSPPALRPGLEPQSLLRSLSPQRHIGAL